ncbi:hypothetical protein GN244_ATG07997 [Phytophthora infestans]|uniref:Uncharacterized protein n=1 Tax=Phytophthora infestans TaxID=4787 RepID=A0A833SYG6_PHYIN|nr:hypothetical protein GN244_ATG07997 [Phytophthora infestans]
MKERLKWLPDEHRAALKLAKGESDDYINALMAEEQILGSKTLATWFYTKNNMELPSSEQIHMLVKVPEGAGGDQELVSLLSTSIQEENARMFNKVAEENREKNRERDRKRVEQNCEENRERDRKQAKEIRKLAGEARKLAEESRKLAAENRKLAEEKRELDRKRAQEIRQQFEKFCNPATPTITDAQLGYEHLNLLQLKGFVSSAEKQSEQMHFGLWKSKPESTAFRGKMILMLSLLLTSAMRWTATTLYSSTASFINGCRGLLICLATAILTSIQMDL